ncbi:bifunctional aspartate kinase/homoserine dehydrogenase II [Marinicella sediminis]|uniref:Bifunctional aspartate kinase/homoserine dehydrogenase II n=1 Tax=Marinicella sediminis TaxID=1792834 RepID=A0ABV7JBY3_9GAMM|nr:bifunctional aspartate kinase/homoserine dehydrogenase II [Marinicella sediminis]
MAEIYGQPVARETPAVHKFGGSSLKDVTAISSVIRTIRSHVRTEDVVVVSANGGVTDQLIQVFNDGTHRLPALRESVQQLVTTVLDQPDALLVSLLEDLELLSSGLSQTTLSVHDVLAYGELWSAQLLSARLHELGIPNHWRDARDILTVDAQNNPVNPAKAVQILLDSKGEGIQILTGFLARNEAGQGITLGRNGSDYSATLVASLLRSSAVYLWTDVDGVYTADPHVIPEARRIPTLTLGEAQALSELGSHVLHHKTINPLLQHPARIIINTCDSDTLGTDVVEQSRAGEGQVKTLAHKSQLVQLTLAGIHELRTRQFQAELTAGQINQYACHYDKTRQVLQLCVEQVDFFRTSQLIRQAGLTLVQQLSGVSLISAVGHNIRQNHRVISQLLGRTARFDVLNIHYPGNDHTLCVLLADEQAEALLADLHAACFDLAPSIPIVVLGYGNIGQQFIRILKDNKASIEQRVKQSLSLVAVANSRHYQYAGECLLDEVIVPDQDNTSGEIYQRLSDYINKPLVLIDLTASEAVAARYPEFVANGWHLISANKLVAADDIRASHLEAELEKQHRRWLTNTTVGAALPIQSSLRKLIESGDQVQAVNGVFSGSLSWIFGQYDGQRPFMEWVRQAHANAYTEPDPRDDLSGQDVYRKALILARQLGFNEARVVFTPAIPDELMAGTLEQFWARSAAIDEHVAGLWKAANEQGKSLCYLASISSQEINVSLQLIDQQHPAAGLRPGDNIFVIDSAWYAGNPLVIQGPGAGREVTAAGVLNDLIEVLQSA